MKEKDFISLMVQETLSLQESSDRAFTLYAQEDIQRMCLSIENDVGELLEVPKNWGPFRDLMGSQIFITAENDSYEFLGVISQFFGYDFQSVRIVLEHNQEESFNKAA